MKGRIPEWGLYRVLKALEDRHVRGILELISTDNSVYKLRLVDGKVIAAIDGEARSFADFLARTQLVKDVSTMPKPPTCARELLESGLVRHSEAVKIQLSHTRSLLCLLLPLGFSSVSFVPAEDVKWALDSPPIDIVQELFRAVARRADVTRMQEAVGRFLTNHDVRLSAEKERLLSDARSMIGDAPVLYLLRQGRMSERKIPWDEKSIRLIFALMVADVLVREAKPFSEDSRMTDIPMPGEPGVEDSKATPVPMPRVPTQDQGVAYELEQVAETFSKNSFYEILGIDVEARISEVEASYAAIMRRYSRSRYEDIPDVEESLRIIHSRLDEARRTLTDHALRVAYNRQIGVSTPSLETRLVTMFEARQQYENGMRFLSLQKHEEALAAFEEAASLDPREPEYKVAIARLLLTRGQPADALLQAHSLIEEALKLREDFVPALICRAILYRIEDHQDLALEQVRAVLRLDPQNREALALKEVLRGHASGTKMVFKKRNESMFEKLKKLFKS